jgi:antitoxin component YwqK of YwqJK toxin-antitoxin module
MGYFMRNSMKITNILILTFLFYSNSKACLCDPPDYLYLDSSELKEYDFIARVRIINAYDFKTPSEYNYLSIQVLELFKGKTISKIFESHKNSSCDLGISDGEEWIIFCKKKNGRIFQEVCDRFQKIRESDGQRINGYDIDINPLWNLRKFYGHKEKKLINGTHKEFYANGKIEIEEQYLNGIKEGVCKMWYPSGQVLRIDTFVNGKLSGISRSWHLNGALQSSGFYINGKLEGKKEDFFPSGQISSIIYSKNNKFYNIYRTYFDTTIHESSFSHLLSENTNQDSLDLIYKKIQIQHEWVYNINGEILIKREYFRNGKLKEEETFLEDINFRIMTTYQENGNILTIGYKKDGKSYGHYQWFDKNGLPEQGWDYDDFGNVINKKD